MSPTVIWFQELTDQLWANGGGVTKEIIATAHYRVSLAQVVASGPYSTFPDTHRVMTIARGGPLRLTIAGQQHTAVLHTPVRFSGAVPTICELLGEPVTNYNLMTYRQHHGDVQIQHFNDKTYQICPHRDHRLVTVLAGQFALRVGHGFPNTQLRFGDSIDLRTNPGPLVLTGTGTLATCAVSA